MIDITINGMSLTTEVIVADLLIIGLIVLLGVVSYKKGLASMIVGTFCLILALVATYFLHPYAGALLEKTGMEESLAQKLTFSLEREEEEEASGQEGEEGELPTDFQISQLSLPEFIKESLISHNTEETYAEMGVSSQEGYLRKYIAHLVVGGIGVLGTFLVCFIAFRLLAKALKLLNEVPLVGNVNQLLGLAAGIIIALVILEGVFFLLSLLSPGIPAVRDLLIKLENGMISGFVIKHNHLIQWVFSRITSGLKIG